MSFFGAPWHHYPRHYDHLYRALRREDFGWYWEQIKRTPVVEPPPPPPPADEERIRKIVREEIAELPIPFDVPDAPPEGER